MKRIFKFFSNVFIFVSSPKFFCLFFSKIPHFNGNSLSEAAREGNTVIVFFVYISHLSLDIFVSKHFVAGINDYVERGNHYMPFELMTIPELKNTKNLSEDQQKQAEGELILKMLQPSDTVVLLDEHGKEYRSVEFARWLEQKRNTARRLVFVIGGPYGFSPAVYARANEQLSLSKMTFSHQMIRLTFTEQVYRACTIIKGEPYHHE